MNYFVKDVPTYILGESRIAGIGSVGVKPGIGLVPRLPLEVDHDHGRHYNWFMNDKDFAKNQPWIDGIQDFFHKHSNSQNLSLCEENDHDYHENDTCHFDYDNLGSICSKFPYGYYTETLIEPCIYFKINRIYLFKPEPY